MTFDRLNLHPKVLSAVFDAGYDEPTPIQAQAIPHAIQGRDVLGIAQTGTGKTASFTLPMISLLARARARARMPRSLILAPTRELAAQVAENFEIYGKNFNLTTALLIGGVSFGDQDKKIDRGADVLIATPGRLLDHFERGKLMLTGIEIMVVDEADRMLDMGFIDDLERIFKLTPFTRQTLFFSATMPPEITRLTNEFLSNPIRVEVAPASSTVDTIEQKLCAVPTARRERTEREKRRALREILALEKKTLKNGIVFCNRKRDVGILFKSLQKHGFNVGALHGDLDQRVRMQVLDGFRNGAIDLLVASDVAARGLDIPSVSHVFNFDVPVNAEDYVHRIGRTGRAGRKGVAYTLAAPADSRLLAQVVQLIGKAIPAVEIAGVTDTAEASVSSEEPEKNADRRRRRNKKADTATQAAAIPDDQPVREQTAQKSHRRDRGDNRRRRSKDDDDPPVIGLGDHVPAFLLREIILPKPPASSDISEAETQSADYDEKAGVPKSCESKESTEQSRDAA